MNRSDASINDSEIHICEQTAVQTHKGWRLGQTMHNFHLCHMRKKINNTDFLAGDATECEGAE